MHISDCEFLSLFFFPQSDVRTPKSTKHIHSIQWSRTKPQDEVKAVQLAIQTLFPNSEGTPGSRSDSSKLAVL